MSAKTPEQSEIRDMLCLWKWHRYYEEIKHVPGMKKQVDDMMQLIEQEVAKRVEAAYDLGHAHELDYSISPNSDERNERHARELDDLLSLKAGDGE